MTDPISASLAEAVRCARTDQGLSVTALAQRSGVSRAMIGRVERGLAQPTAALLGRLSGALGLTLSQLVARAEAGEQRRLVRAADQPTWTDPVSGYRRRAVSPTSGEALELVEVELPGRAEVSYPADTYTFTHHQIWVLQGRLDFREGPTLHHLGTGDCLQLGPPAPCTFANPDARPCRYLVALTPRPNPQR